MSAATPSRPGRATALIGTTYVAYFYVLMEWLFFVTKPSFMDSFSMGGIVGALLLPPLALLLVGLPLAVLLGGFGGPVRPAALAPAAVLGSAFFLLADTFVYTFFRWGVVASGPFIRFLLAGVYLGALWGGYRLFVWLERALADRARAHLRAVVLMLSTSALALGVQVAASDTSLAEVEVRARDGEIRRPNIIFLSSDAIDAQFTSLYGFGLPTTPFLQRLAASSLVFENAFSNAGKTTGSTVSMLSGKTAWRLKVGFPPQILPREHAFQHLPAMLRVLGYRGFQRSIRYYGDGGDLNMQSAFERANLRDVPAPVPGSLGARLLYVFNAEAIFATRLTERLAHRLLHVFGVKSMVNHFVLAQSNEGLGLELDRDSIDRALAFIARQDGPFFMHVHLMGTHCCTWEGGSGWFERTYPQLAEQKPYSSFHFGRMLGSLHDADELFESFVASLDRSGLLEESILVVSSDHTRSWDTDQRIPLLIRFPGGWPRGLVRRNAELIDLPATILDYMGVERPQWMTSRSLLDPDPAPTESERQLLIRDHRPIVSLARFTYERYGVSGAWFSSMPAPGPPHYGVKHAGVVQCDRWLKLDLESGLFLVGKVAGHTDPCVPSELTSPAEVAAWLRRELEREGFSFSF